MPSQRVYFLYIVILIFILKTTPASLARSQGKCDTTLAEAKRNYYQGYFDRALDLANDCLNQGNLTKEEQKSVNRLLAWIYISRNDSTKAKESAQKLLDWEPDFKPDPKTDPLEFMAIIESIRQRQNRQGIEPGNLKAIRTPPIFQGKDTVLVINRIEDAAQSQQAKELIDPRRLFINPDANVLRSLEVNLGGSTFEDPVLEKRSYLGRARIGLGGVFEIEFSIDGIIDSLSKKVRPSIPTGALKGKFITESRIRPAVACGVRISQQESVPIDTLEVLKKRLITYYLVAAKTVGPASFYAGLTIRNARIYKTGIDGYENKKYITDPFVGLQWAIKQRTRLIIELGRIPEFTKTNGEDDVFTRLVMIVGVRFFVFRWLGIDAGFRYPRYKEPKIETGVNVGFSLQKLFKKVEKD